ncbi:MAG: cytochrome b/b6 domain-containing protein [Candidatus Zixiibacteriota bacterium]|nr:MAG: cytochrome b/b6 domain-containing protein [candidate division Zixibacteria bacterium]
MTDSSNPAESKRESLISELAEDIVQDAATIAEPDEDRLEQVDEMTAEARRRLSFEVSVLLNEAVTKLSPGRAYEERKETPQRTFQRFGVNFRLQHALMFVSVIILIITGMPLKFPELAISKFIIIDLLGGLQNSTLIHRVGAVGLIIVGVWHLFYITFSRDGRRDFFLMMPRPKDIKNFFQTLLYFFGRRPSPPKFGRFSFIEKFDYWAVYWGMVIMIGSGLIMWFKEWFPKYLFDIGREAHSDEGLLATLAIVIWHFYNVHFNPDVFPMSWVWWHGKLTEDEMKHHHPLEYAEIMESQSARIVEEKLKVADTEEATE